MQLDILTKRQDFINIAKSNKKAVAKGIVLQAIDRCDEQENIRFGLTVSKKVGNAVVRNRVKRKFRVVLKEVFPKLAKPGYDYVLIGRVAAFSRHVDDLTKDLKYALHNIHG